MKKLLLILFGIATAQGADLKSLSVLYIGDTDSPRANHFNSFLRTNVSRVQTAARNAFDPATAANFDVVVLDWPQQGMDLRKATQAPIGPRENWNKPTVLVGSAGLNLAVVWKVRGGSG